MTPETKACLQGQVLALGVLATAVADTVRLHNSRAAEELDAIYFACNRAHNRLGDTVEDE